MPVAMSNQTRQGKPLKPTKSLKTSGFCTDHPLYISPVDLDAIMDIESRNMPPLNGNVSLRYDTGSLLVEATECFSSKQDRVDPVLNEEVTAGWPVTDVKAGELWGQWSLTGCANNIFDKYYFSHLSYQRDPFASGEKVPEIGRLAYLTLAYEY